MWAANSLRIKIQNNRFDINQKLDMMRNHIDPSNELPSSAFAGADIEFTADTKY